MNKPLVEVILIWLEERLADAWEWYEARERRKRRAGVIQDIHINMGETDYQVDVEETTQTVYTVNRIDNAVHLPRKRLN